METSYSGTRAECGALIPFKFCAIDLKFFNQIWSPASNHSMAFNERLNLTEFAWTALESRKRPMHVATLLI